MSVDYQQALQIRKSVTAGSSGGRWPQLVREAVMAGTLLASVSVAPVRADEPAQFVGAAACFGCHQAETAPWKSSHHAKAMQVATSNTVLGSFDGTEQSPNGTTFSHSGEAYSARTEAADGQSHDYPIAYTFGVDPPQQYLVGSPGGRLQALGSAWDSREREKGGHRWFALYPDQKPAPNDPLHWTGRDQTWNYMCAACHSTNPQKNYDPDSNNYKTTWTDVDVSCEAAMAPVPPTSAGPRPGSCLWATQTGWD